MNHAYNSQAASKAYEEFLASEDGHIFRQAVGNAMQNEISKASAPSPLRILDAGCGDGWLAGFFSSNTAIQQFNPEIHACDAGAPLIEIAKQKYPKVQFQVCDLNTPLPYQENFFDAVTASMVLHDVEDEAATLRNIAAVLKPGGKLIATIVNPYYGYPIGEWKRGVAGRILQGKPALRLARFYNRLMEQKRPSFEWRVGLGSHFTPLSHHITAATQAQFVLTGLTDITSNTDSPTYNLTYQLYRFPIILLLEFTKAALPPHQTQ